MPRSARPQVVLKLKSGRSGDPVARISFWPQGVRTYVWAGGQRCLGFVSGPRRLERFARALLAEVAEPERRKAKLGRKVAKRIKVARSRASGGRKGGA